MSRRRAPRIIFAFLSAAALGLGCAESEPVDITAIGARGRADAGDPTSGAGGSFGIAGASGGSVVGAGSGGSGVTITSGQAGNNGAAGNAGNGDSITSGQAGAGDTAGRGGAGSGGAGGGSAGRGGTGGGSAGRGGTSGGSAGRGGTSGSSGGRGGAGGTTGSGGAPDAGAGADAGTAATFTDIYMNILVQYCSGTACHNPGSQRGISFANQATAYTAVRNRVTPGNGTNSSFYRTVNGGSMPPGNKLSATDIAKIRSWIDAGALNN